MPILTDEQSADLAMDYMKAANELTMYRVKHFAEISLEERQELSAAEDKLRSMANMVLDLEIEHAVENLQEQLDAIMKATRRGAAAIKKINDVKQGIKIATSVIKLGAAAVTGNPAAIASAIGDLATAVKETQQPAAA